MRPNRDQTVVLVLRDSPATSKTLIPVIRELKEREAPPFLVVTRGTERFLNLKLHEGHAFVNELKYGFIDNLKATGLRESARLYSEEMAKILPLDLFTDSADWIAEGLTGKVLGKEYFKDCRFLLADSDIGAFEKGIFLGHSENGGVSAILQHGFFDERQFPIHSQYHLDWGPYFTAKALSYGHPADRSVSLGCPRFDPLENIEKKKLKEGKGSEDNKPSVLAISNVHAHYIYPQAITSFFDSIKALMKSGIGVTIRRHPSETSMKIYQDFLGSELLGKCRFVEAGEDLCGAMLAHDVVFQSMSAASIEAMLLGIPVLWQECAEGNPFTDIPSNGGGVYVDSLSIVDAVMELGSDGTERKGMLSRQENFLEMAVVNRGRAAKAVADRLEERCDVGKG